jgi:hypothetical protein
MTVRAGRQAFSTLAAMSGRPVKLGLLAAGACLALAGCGDDSGGAEIPEDTATAMQKSLQELESAQASRDCATAEEAARDFASNVDELGDDVDEEIRDSLDAGADQVNALVERQLCAETGTSPAETIPPPTETLETEPETIEETTTTTTETGGEGEDEGEDVEGEESSDSGPSESELPPEGEEGANAPPGPEGNPGELAPGGGVGPEED